MTEDEAKRAAMDGDWETVARYVVRRNFALPDGFIIYPPRIEYSPQGYSATISVTYRVRAEDAHTISSALYTSPIVSAAPKP